MYNVCITSVSSLLHLTNCTKQQNNIPIRTGEWTAPEVEKINELIPACITTKPIVYLVNLSSESFVTKKSKWLVRIGNWVKAHGGGTVIPFSVEFEQVIHVYYILMITPIVLEVLHKLLHVLLRTY
jgi:ribosome-binding ATPase YchF (GTP1/OBG family)